MASFAELPPCPCGLPYEDVRDACLVNGFVCPAPDADGAQCGRRLADHPRRPVCQAPRVEEAIRTEAALEEAIHTEEHPRKRRWDILAAALQQNADYKECKRGPRKGSFSVPYSSVTYDSIKDAFNFVPCVFPEGEHLSQEQIHQLALYYERMHKSFGDLIGKELKRLLYIAPILISVCCFFYDKGEPVTICTEQDIDGRQVPVNGHFEFVLNKGTRRVCIVEAKKDDIEQGMAQDLLGLEAVADVDRVDEVCGIVSTYLEWVFLRSTNAGIERELTTIQLIDGTTIPTAGSLSKISAKIIALLN